MRLTPLPAFEDNYIWALVADDGQAVVIDPGQAEPVLAAAASRGIRPQAVLLTHHHDDHIGGVAALLEHYPSLTIHAPRDERIPLATHRVDDDARFEVLGQAFQVLSVPGHTRSHVAYVGGGRLFCGDTLFSLGCGRMFEGTAPQMLGSLRRLASLPGETLVCCGHEYTLANAAFALHVDPANAALQRRQQEALAMRENARPTLPALLSGELATNPFLRTGSAPVRDAISRRIGRQVTDDVDAFAELRRWKDEYRA